MSKYYEVVDISQKPDKDDWYYVMNPNKEILPQMIEYKMGIFHNYNNASASYYLKPIDHLPLSRQQADPSVLLEALEEIGKKMTVNENDGTSMFPQLVKECKERVLIARKALAAYKESIKQ